LIQNIFHTYLIPTWIAPGFYGNKKFGTGGYQWPATGIFIRPEKAVASFSNVIITNGPARRTGIEKPDSGTPVEDGVKT
jgi:hypothetical protein